MLVRTPHTSFSMLALLTGLALLGACGDDGDDGDDVMTSCRHYGVHTKTWKQQKRGQRHLPRSWTFLFRRHRQHTTSSSLLKT